ncbi:hypothetical protein HYW55_01060 [Candidatus Gottesmanbacteria bacterium]|nr:hypothetical protein [Candidatus Gottesmanbacteria bacterium]
MFLKLFLVAVGGIFFGGMVVFLFMTTSSSKISIELSRALQENANLKVENSTLQKTIEAMLIKPAFSSPTEPLDESASQKGAITGVLGYPSEVIPALVVYAFKEGAGSMYFSVETKPNQGTFTIPNVDPGSYTVVAYVKDGPSTLSGGYTKAVACGLKVECTDHSLVIVEVKEGETVKGVEVRDWYAPEGTFPQKPK